MIDSGYTRRFVLVLHQDHREARGLCAGIVGPCFTAHGQPADAGAQLPTGIRWLAGFNWHRTSGTKRWARVGDDGRLRQPEGCMLRTFKHFENCTIGASDGDIDHQRGPCCDDCAWAIRCVRVEAGSWPSSRKVPIAPISTHEPDRAPHPLTVAIMRVQAEASPEIDTDRPATSAGFAARGGARRATPCTRPLAGAMQGIDVLFAHEDAIEAAS